MQSVMEQDDGKKVCEHDKAIVKGKSNANWGKKKVVFPYVLGSGEKIHTDCYVYWNKMQYWNFIYALFHVLLAYSYSLLLYSTYFQITRKHTNI